MVLLVLLAGCADHVFNPDRQPYDPKHSAADRYGQRSDFVNGSFWADLCDGFGGEWSNAPNGSCQGFLWRDVLPQPKGS